MRNGAVDGSAQILSELAIAVGGELQLILTFQATAPLYIIDIYDSVRTLKADVMEYRDNRPWRRRKDNVLTREEIESMVAAGRSIIIVDGKVLKTDAWLNFHPGGEKAIRHMVGRDATDEVNA